MKLSFLQPVYRIECSPLTETEKTSFDISSQIKKATAKETEPMAEQSGIDGEIEHRGTNAIDIIKSTYRNINKEILTQKFSFRDVNFVSRNIYLILSFLFLYLFCR